MIEVTKWNPKGYPSEYLAGFTMLSDQAAAFRMAEHLRDSSDIISILAETDDPGTIVYSLSFNSESFTSRQLNWSDPKKKPWDYFDRENHQKTSYARTFHRFYGPSDQQITRADLLAQELNVTFGNIDLRKTSLEYPDHGNLLEAFAWELRGRQDPVAVPKTPENRRYTFKTIAGAFAEMALEENMNKGHSLAIPSLGITTVRILAPKLPTPR